MFASRVSITIRRIISDSSILVGGGIWLYYSMSNIKALF